MSMQQPVISVSEPDAACLTRRGFLCAAGALVVGAWSVASASAATTLLEQKREKLRGGIFTKALWDGKPERGLERVLACPYLTGLNVGARWLDIEPSPGQFRWELVDQMLQRAERRNLTVSLGITGGVWTPDWVYQKHKLPSVEFVHQKEWVKHAVGKKYRVPHVWETTYQEAFLETVAALARRYDNNPRVIRVFVCGPTFFFNEFHIEPWLAKVMQPHGFTERKYVEGWKRMFDRYAALLPNTPLDLALVPFEGRLEPLEELMNHALKSAPRQVVFSNHSLNDRAMGNRRHPLARLYKRFAEVSAKVPIGYELTEYLMSDGPAFSQPIEQQNPTAFARVIEWASDNGAWFIHPHANRLLNPANVATFEKFRATRSAATKVIP